MREVVRVHRWPLGQPDLMARCSVGVVSQRDDLPRDLGAAVTTVELGQELDRVPSAAGGDEVFRASKNRRDLSGGHRRDIVHARRARPRNHGWMVPNEARSTAIGGAGWASP